MSETSQLRTPRSTPGTAWTIASVAVFAAGAAMRWSGLARFPFLQDELYTLQESRELFGTTLRPGIDARPLYYLIHHALTPLLPHSEFGARLPAFCFGLLGLIITWRLGKYVAGEAGGFLALTLCVFSPWQLFVSGEARYWSLDYLLAACALLMILRAYDTDRWATHAFAGALLIAGSLTHPTFMFTMLGVAAAQLIHPSEDGLKFAWPSRRSLFATWLPTGLAVGGYLLALKLAGRGSTLSNWSGRGWLATLRLLPAMVQLTTPAIIAAAAVGTVSSLLSSSIRAKRLALAAVGGMLSGTILLFLASTRTDVYADYGVSMLPLGLGIAACVVLLPGLTRPGPIACALAAILIAATSPEMVSQLSNGMRYDYRPAFRVIEQASVPRPALVWPLVIQRYYAPEIQGIEFNQDVVQLDSLATATAGFWVVASEDRTGLVLDSDGAVQRWLDGHCRTELTSTGRRFDYRVYRVELYSCSRQVE